MLNKLPIKGRCIQNLKDKYRVVLTLFLLEGYDHREISQILGISEVTSRTHLLRGKKKVKEPVFSSYIFARVDEAQRQQILIDPSIVSSVFWLRRPVRIRDFEIEAIKEFLDDFSQVKGAQLDISQGDRAVITSGPFRGEEGVVREKRGGKVLLQLHSLGLELQAEVAIGKLDAVK